MGESTSEDEEFSKELIANLEKDPDLAKSARELELQLQDMRGEDKQEKRHTTIKNELRMRKVMLKEKE